VDLVVLAGRAGAALRRALEASEKLGIRLKGPKTVATGAVIYPDRSRVGVLPGARAWIVARRPRLVLPASITGGFVLGENVPREMQVAVVVAVPGFELGRCEIAGRDHLLSLNRISKATARGIVLGQGRRVTGAEVWLRDEPSRRTTTNERGEFSLGAVKRGAEICARAGEEIAEVGFYSVATIKLKLQRTHELRVIVADMDTGEIIPTAQVGGERTSAIKYAGHRSSNSTPPSSSHPTDPGSM
jgi:hypothetical protein